MCVVVTGLFVTDGTCHHAIQQLCHVAVRHEMRTRRPCPLFRACSWFVKDGRVFWKLVGTPSHHPQCRAYALMLLFCAVVCALVPSAFVLSSQGASLAELPEVHASRAAASLLIAGPGVKMAAAFLARELKGSRSARVRSALGTWLNVSPVSPTSPVSLVARPGKHVRACLPSAIVRTRNVHSPVLAGRWRPFLVCHRPACLSTR